MIKIKIIGIICEYNPFHNGHIYHIEEIKKKYPNSLIILCLNGYFLQRGEISLLTKEDKVRLALTYNVDLVVELPSIYGCQSADNFANGAILILNALNVQKIIFGSECNDIDYLMSIAKKQVNLNKEALKKQLKKGHNYPKSLITSLNIEHLHSNDLLGISYCKAILKYNPLIKPETIKRTNIYHDTTLEDNIVSASNIRKKIETKQNISKYLPEESLNCLQTINYSKYFSFLKHSILTNHNINEILDVTEGIEYLLRKKISISSSLEEFLNNIKSKRYTINRLNRMLTHIYLGYDTKYSNTPIDYIHILGFNDLGQKYLKENKDKFLLPTKVNHHSLIFQFEYLTSLLYDLLANTNCSTFELNNKPIYMKTVSFDKESTQK